MASLEHMLAKKSVLHEPNSERDVAVNSLERGTAKLDVPLFQIVKSEPLRRMGKGVCTLLPWRCVNLQKEKKSNYLKVKSVRISCILF